MPVIRRFAATMAAGISVWRRSVITVRLLQAELLLPSTVQASSREIAGSTQTSGYYPVALELDNFIQRAAQLCEHLPGMFP